MAQTKPSVASQTGLAQHPKYFNCKIHPGMKIPGDTRLLRDVKVNELPSYLAKQDLSPLGLYHIFKRARERYLTKFMRCRNPKGFIFAHGAIIIGIGSYMADYEYIKRTEQRRKYH